VLGAGEEGEGMGTVMTTAGTCQIQMQRKTGMSIKKKRKWALVYLMK
jgi:hypothetical protein